ncbi:MAG: pyruvate, phosphate dikinase [Bacillales bacterium]|jgi:pyruvate,orthophosphate dikinase|nr:pyruvate, phosphate dikinase [Bacillales bacterium]
MKYVYLFKEGNKDMKNTLGGKGANLAEMSSIGLPVPQGFTVICEACGQYYEDGEKINESILKEIDVALLKLEKETGKKLGDATEPLLVSVRSGARISMPGMMDTILNLGINDVVVETIAAKTNNPRFAYDSYRRFMQMFGEVALGLPYEDFDNELIGIKKEKGVESDVDLTADDLKELVKRYKKVYAKHLDGGFPTDPKVQLTEAIKAVFRSWNTERAIFYRQQNNIPHEWGTAVNVQQMVFGNKGETSGTGVAFSRDPSTGENVLYGEFLMNAQGEDVVAGIRTPSPISQLKDTNEKVYNQFVSLVRKLETHYKDMQDMEFTIEEGTLYFLQTRNGKRTGHAALRIAVEMYQEGLINKEQGLLQIDPKTLDSVLHPSFEPKALKEAKEIGKGLNAGPGAAIGQIVFNSARATELKGKGIKTILVRPETSPEDIKGMHSAEGILTATGGMTSHAAVVARGMGKCCVCGAKDAKINEEAGTLTLAGVTYKEGDIISLDGSTGKIYAGKIPTIPAAISGNFAEVMKWSDEIRVLDVRTNADTPADTQKAVEFGAQGIGLTRTEHMFFEGDRIRAVREMLVSKTKEQRASAINKILPMQQNDFEQIFEALGGRPATIRFIDPPLHEFLPHTPKEIKEVANAMNIPVGDVEAMVEASKEFNPMMGFRGCRLIIAYPEIAEMQTRAVIQAALKLKKQHPDWNDFAEIMIPLTIDLKELEWIKKIVVRVADELIKASKTDLRYKFGTMIEIPRAAMVAGEIATIAEFFSFGTNDLTQMTFGFSRDDASKFLPYYYDNKILVSDPFATVDQVGVGRVIKIAVEGGQQTRPDIKLGVCGEHGGDPDSIEFFHRVGLKYVSCSPFRVPIARLAAARAQLKFPREKH